MVLESESARHMSGILSFFTSISYFKIILQAILSYLGDGTSTVPILGFDSIDININNYRIILDNVLYFPNLNDTLFSINE